MVPLYLRTRMRPGTARRYVSGYLFILACLAPLGALACEPGPEYRVIIDPGHGGANLRTPDDKWDPVTRRYLSNYLYGTTYKNYKEYDLMMRLGRRVHAYLRLTETTEGWAKFEELLRQFSPAQKFERIVIRAQLSRTESYDELPASAVDRNERYRLYDFPDSGGRLQPGRLSWINQQEPHLVVSLHMNPAGIGHAGGMAAVLTPGFATFNTLRKIHLGQLDAKVFQEMPWKGKWLVTDAGWSQFEAARADTWVYFNGYRTNRAGTAVDESKNRGIRQNMVQWRYGQPPGWEQLYDDSVAGQYARQFARFKPEGPFWEREMGAAEDWRREGGPLGYGGDNHYATDELMRFVQYGVRAQVPAKRAEAAIGPIQVPYISSYSLPMLTNAICAYLEIAFINRKRDRDLVIETREETARSLAVGIYSLFRGLELRKTTYGPYRPRGKAVNWARYENYKDGNYFEIVDD